MTANKGGYSHQCYDDLILEAKTRENSSPLLSQKPKTKNKLSKKSDKFLYNQSTLEPTAEISSVDSNTKSQEASKKEDCIQQNLQQNCKKNHSKNEIERKRKTELCRNFMITGTCKYQKEVSKYNPSAATPTVTTSCGAKPTSTFTTRAKYVAHSRTGSAPMELAASISTTTIRTDTSPTRIAKGSVSGWRRTRSST